VLRASSTSIVSGAEPDQEHASEHDRGGDRRRYAAARAELGPWRLGSGEFDRGLLLPELAPRTMTTSSAYNPRT
jgi:hypothetical protein